MIHFVGAGPGAPDLITLRGEKYLEQADVVIYAGSLINPALLGFTKDDCRVYNSARMTLAEVIAVMCDAERKGLSTVRLHTGDPSLYSAIREQMDALDAQGISYDVVPGVSAFSAAAADLHAELTLPGISQSLTITRAEGRTGGMLPTESLRSYAAHHATLALYLSASKAVEVQRELRAGGLSDDTPVDVVYHASWEDEIIVHSSLADFPQDMAREEIHKTAVILVGEVLGQANIPFHSEEGMIRIGSAASTGIPAEKYGEKISGTGNLSRTVILNRNANEQREHTAGHSRLYDPRFSTGYREASGKRMVFFACSAAAAGIMEKVREDFLQDNPVVQIRTVIKAKGMPDYEPRSLYEITKEEFGRADLLIYFGAAGIAVRSIAPFVRDKAEDPAVLVVDEQGKYCIPILSGHIGGANEYAKKVSDFIGATAVITTATDLLGRFAVDVFAGQNGLVIREREAAKEFSAAIVRGEVERVWIDPVLDSSGTMPAEVRLVNDRKSADLIISPFENPEDQNGALHLIPRVVHVGIGCRRGTAKEAIRQAVENAARQAGIFPESICKMASISLKKDEEGILEAAREMCVPAVFYTPEELNAVPGSFTHSDFVWKTTGTDNVCERSCMASALEADVNTEKHNHLTPSTDTRKNLSDNAANAAVNQIQSGLLDTKVGAVQDPNDSGAELLMCKTIYQDVTIALAVQRKELIWRKS